MENAVYTTMEVTHSWMYSWYVTVTLNHAGMLSIHVLGSSSSSMDICIVIEHVPFWCISDPLSCRYALLWLRN